MSKRRFDSLLPAHRDAVAAVAAAVTPQQRQMNESADAEALADLKKHGTAGGGEAKRDSPAPLGGDPGGRGHAAGPCPRPAGASARTRALGPRDAGQSTQ